VAEEQSADNGKARLGLSPKPNRNVFGVPGKKNVSKRWMYTAIAVIGLLILFATTFSKKAKLPAPQRPHAAAINLTPKGLAEKTWTAQEQTRYQSLENSNESLKATVTTLAQQIKQMQRSLEEAKTENAQNAGSSSASVLPPPPPPPPALPVGASGTPQQYPSTEAPGLENSGSSNQSPTGPYVFSPPALPKQKKTVTSKTTASSNAQTDTGILLTGAFVRIVMLNGIDAGTSSQTMANPEPVLLRVQDNAVLPGSAKYKLRSCFILADGYGSLSSERVYLRLSALSCVDRHKKLVLSVPVRGYVVDSDSMLGLRGKVIDRQGAKIGKALLAGFAQGLSNALGGAQETVTTSALGMESTLTGSSALKEAGLSGAANASDQIAQFYLQQAQSIFPVISVRGGRLGTAVFTENVPLKWGDVQGVTQKSNP